MADTEIADLPVVDTGDVISLPAEKICHFFEAAEWPRALCGFDLTERKSHPLEVCASSGHGLCSMCFVMHRNQRQSA
jgi:hypothetical protein